jgi:hypothetical protein
MYIESSNHIDDYYSFFPVSLLNKEQRGRTKKEIVYCTLFKAKKHIQGELLHAQVVKYVEFKVENYSSVNSATKEKED